MREKVLFSGCRGFFRTGGSVVWAVIFWIGIQGMAMAQAQEPTRTVKDLLGREVPLPQEIHRVISTCPTTTTIVYMLAPDSLVGWNFKPDVRNMPEKYRELPIVGGWFGLWSGNYETMINLHPEVILYETYFDDPQKGDLKVLEERQDKFGAIPVVGILNSGDLKDLDRVIEFLGSILGAPERAGSLIRAHALARETIRQKTASISEDRRVRVYYAEGPKGMLTDPQGSRHSALIGLCGGINVAICPMKEGMGQTEVSIEQILAWNPEVIITENPKFFNSVFKNPLWAQVRAVKNQKVYLTPRGPFCWFDRPPGASTILGLYWTGQKLYPELFADVDLRALTRDFYRDFYHYALSDEEIDRLISPKVGEASGFFPHR